MALPLSQDLRSRIVRAVSEGSSIRQAAARFDVSPSLAITLMQRVRATGSTAPAKIGGYRPPLLDGHEVLLQELTAAKPGITLVEIKDALRPPANPGRFRPRGRTLELVASMRFFKIAFNCPSSAQERLALRAPFVGCR